MRTRAATLAAVIVGATALASYAAPRHASHLPPAATTPSPDPAAGPGAPMSPSAALAALDRKILDMESEERATKEELTTLSKGIADTRARVEKRGRAFYRSTRVGMLPVGGGFDELVRHAIHVERARHSLIDDLSKQRELGERAGELSHALERLARDRLALASQRTAMDAARLAVEDEQRRQKAFDRAFETSTGAGDYVAVYGANGVSPDVATTGFASQRGRLLFPIAGRAEVRPARREGTDGPGLEIQASVGTPVRAAYAGRVAFADRYGPYGRIVIVDHGEHYYTVCGNLAAIDVKVGQEVVSGERLGTVGDDGHGPMLYFEVRHGSQTMAPGPWLGVP